MIMDLIIKEEVLKEYQLTPEQIKTEFAIAMFQQRKWSGGKSRHFLGLDVMEWQSLLFDREIEPHAGLEGFRQDMKTLDKLWTVQSAKEKV